MMLNEFLKAAVELDADELEFEYKGRALRVTAFRGAMGVGIGSVESNSTDCKKLIDDLASLKKRKRAEIAGQNWRAAVSEYESFGELAWRVRLAKPT